MAEVKLVPASEARVKEAEEALFAGRGLPRGLMYAPGVGAQFYEVDPEISDEDIENLQSQLPHNQANVEPAPIEAPARRGAAEVKDK